jgi:hypothetical protein
MSDPVEAVARALEKHVDRFYADRAPDKFGFCVFRVNDTDPASDSGAKVVEELPFLDEHKFAAHARAERRNSRDRALAAIAAYHEALEADGWQVVPKEPTREMIWEALSRESPFTKNSYRAMLQAAPTPKERDDE